MPQEYVDTTLLDGYAGGPHITVEQVGLANQGLYGADDYVLETGKKAAAQILTNNSIRIFDAVYVIQGRRDVINANGYKDVSIANGSQGMNRNDIIIRRYEKDESSEIEKTSYAVIKGVPAAGVATDPEVTVGDIKNGATLHEMALYRVRLNGLNIVGIDPLFKTLVNMSEIQEMLTDLNSKMTETIKEIKLVSKTCTTTGTTGELGSYYGTINLTDIPENCVAVLPIGATKTGTPGYPAILAPYKWESLSLKCTIWNVISSKSGEYGACFAYLIK